VFDIAASSPCAQPDEGELAVQAFCRIAAAMRVLALRAARALAAIERTGIHHDQGSSSIGEFGERNCMSAHQARALLDVGRALDALPGLLDDVLSGAIPLGSAAILGEITRCCEALRVERDWYGLARDMSANELRRLYMRRRAEMRAGEPVEEVAAYVTHRVHDDLHRARDLVSRRMHEVVTMGEALGVVAGEWLDDHDPLRGKEGTRRLPDTSTIPDPRFVPAEVDREVRRRNDDRCIVPFCDNRIWVEMSHRIAHAVGGSREARNIDQICDGHHDLFGAGLLRITGPPDAPHFTDRHGRSLHERWRYTLHGPSP
jgi:hypothetical protein